MTPAQSREAGALLLKLRNEKGWRQKDVPGVGQSTVCVAERDPAGVGPGALAKIAAAVGADLTGILPPGYLVPRPEAGRGPVGTRLRELRRAEGWTQRELARRASVSRAVVAFTEAGRRPLAAGTAGALARALGTTAAELLAGCPLNAAPEPSASASVLARAARAMREDAAADRDPPGSFIPAFAGLLEAFAGCECDQDGDHWPQKAAALTAARAYLGEGGAS